MAVSSDRGSDDGGGEDGGSGDGGFSKGSSPSVMLGKISVPPPVFFCSVEPASAYYQKGIF